MLKFFKNWKFVFILTLLLLYIVYFTVVYKTELELPSEKWSRDLLLTEFKAESISEAMANSNISSIPISDENVFITFWYNNNNINYSIINSQGIIVLKDNLNFSIESLKKIRGIYRDNIIFLYSLENRNLKIYEFDFKANKVLSKKNIADDVKDFIVREDILIYSNNNSLNFVDTSGHKETVKNINVEKFEIIKDKENPLYHIALYEKLNSKDNYLTYLTYNLNNRKINVHKLTSIANSVKISLDRVDIGIIDDKINILASLNDNRFGTNVLHNFTFKKNDVSNFSKNTMSLNGSKPYPQILKEERKKLTFIASVNLIKGKDTETVNLIKYTIDKKNNITGEKLLTKTNSLSVNPYYFNLSNNDYLVWTDINGRNKSILISSNSNDIIKASKKLRSSEILDLFMATFTSLIPSIFISLISVMNIFMPTILFIFIVSVINLRWVEFYYNRVFIIIFILHSILKIFYTNRILIDNHEVYKFLPIFLKNPISLYFLIGIATLIALYCLKLFLKNSKNRKHLVKTYSFFAFIDIFIYTFLTIPYVYSYLLLTYKINIS
ncbi:hypothetical protein [Maledivibacter halophilus]|uniref:Uncharacterized protein n=1 Tax=Maledivibacter halophilus TaxID=36842 RepID=A0A1T5MLS5_9FIRM|nr:hypothetical protein [Maledivibacter halophilus]SKC88848.1 hypothetical protein SAMN02194393_04925 [Maledivibacter halophilus]